jgi:hypothetical protein
MPVLWIHRSGASDILIQFSEMRKQDAIAFAHNFLYEVSDGHCVTETEDAGNDMITLGASASVQIALASFDNFHPNDYLNMGLSQQTWNPRGFVQIAEDEARDLGLTGEPEGFVPYSSQGIWKPDYRTQDDLDAELDEYYARTTNEMTVDSD